MHLSLKGGAWRIAQRVHEAEWVQHYPAIFAGLSVWFQHIKPLAFGLLADGKISASFAACCAVVSFLFAFAAIPE
ncbi:hypothetical protein [uncultured Rothia sp.]|uniref:hypothetical protein n=1 Tax=uncultured Rothia sp. TaxID=316088 RepID=UPI0028DCA614|nr:hypothetical protein [uncultured Rothia sp.]